MGNMDKVTLKSGLGSRKSGTSKATSASGDRGMFKTTGTGASRNSQKPRPPRKA